MNVYTQNLDFSREKHLEQRHEKQYAQQLSGLNLALLEKYPRKCPLKL